MRGELMYKILNAIEDTIIDFVDLQKSLLISGYGATSGKINSNFEKIKKQRISYEIKRQEEQEAKLRLQKYIHKLQISGLLQKDGVKISISNNGIKKLIILRKKLLKDIPREVSSNLIILSYDIPVRERKLRDRLLEILKILEFQMIHQSLWVGKIKIPKELLRYFAEINILRYIEILEVTKQGTLKQIT